MAAARTARPVGSGAGGGGLKVAPRRPAAAPPGTCHANGCKTAGAMRAPPAGPPAAAAHRGRARGGAAPRGETPRRITAVIVAAGGSPNRTPFCSASVAEQTPNRCDSVTVLFGARCWISGLLEGPCSTSSRLGAITLAALRAGSWARRDGTSGQSQTASQIALRAAPAAGEGRENSQFTVKSEAVGRASSRGWQSVSIREAAEPAACLCSCWIR